MLKAWPHAGIVTPHTGHHSYYYRHGTESQEQRKAFSNSPFLLTEASPVLSLFFLLQELALEHLEGREAGESLMDSKVLSSDYLSPGKCACGTFV